MKLYYVPHTCALACWIALEWAKDANAIADYEVETLTMAQVHSDDYKAINPLTQVPALAIDGKIYGQAGAILQYVADLCPTLGADAGAVNRLEFNGLMNFLASDLHPTFGTCFVPNRFTTDSSEQTIESVRTASFARIDRALTHLDNLLGDSNHLYRNKRTVLDAYAFVIARWSSHLKKSWQDYPNIKRFVETMHNDPTIQTILNNA